MSVVRRQGIKNTIYTYFGIILGIISTLYIQPFFLTKEQIGITRLILSVSSIFTSISCLGITAVIVKFFPLFYDKEKKHSGFFTLAALFPFIGFIVCFLAILLFEKRILSFYGKNATILSDYFIPITLITFFNCFIFAFTAYCNAINKSSLSTFVNEIFNRAGFIICILLFSYSITNQNGYIYTLSVIYFFQLVFLFFMISYFDHPKLSLSFFSKNMHLQEIIRYGLFSAFIQITAICIKFIDVIFLGKYESLKQIGIYSIAVFIGLVIETPLTALEKIAGTKISKLFAENNLGEIEKIYKLSSKYMMIFCGLLSCILVTSVQPLLSLLPNDYSSGAIVTIIICMGAFFNSATGVNYSIITYSNYYKLGAAFYFSLLIITIGLNIFLIPRYGIMGAAIATCLVSVLNNLLRLIFIKMKLNMQPFSFNSLKLVFVIFLTVFFSYKVEVENTYFLIFFRGVTSATIFTGLLIIFKVFSIKEIKHEVVALKKVFK